MSNALPHPCTHAFHNILRLILFSCFLFSCYVKLINNISKCKCRDVLLNGGIIYQSAKGYFLARHLVHKVLNFQTTTIKNAVSINVALMESMFRDSNVCTTKTLITFCCSQSLLKCSQESKCLPLS